MNLGLPWFGPKRRLGWGWTPITWQGWLITAIFVVVAMALTLVSPFHEKRLAILALVAANLIVVVATGTKPGGRWY